MLTMIIPILFVADAICIDSICTDTLRTDTLREVNIQGSQRLPVEYILDRSLMRIRDDVRRPPNLSDLLEKMSPGIKERALEPLKDMILYPFAFKERRRERRRKRWMKALQKYDQIRTFDELLHEAYDRQMKEDSLRRLQDNHE